MRFVFMDEAGKSALEPVTVVVGLIVHADKQLALAEAAINDLLLSVPQPYRDGFIFHATQVWNDKKYREHWMQPDRLRFLKKMMSLPRKLNIPISIGMVRRGFAKRSTESKLTFDQIEHLVAFISCLGRADKYIRDHADPEEIATVVAEADGSMNKYLKKAPQFLKDHPIHASSDDLNMTSYEQQIGYILQESEQRVSRIRGAIQFVDKDSDKMTLLADACAFGFRRYFSVEQFGADFITSILGKELDLFDYRGPINASTFSHRDRSQPEPF